MGAMGALGAMGAAEDKSTRGENRLVDSTDRKNKNSSKEETAITKKKIGEVKMGSLVKEASSASA